MQENDYPQKQEEQPGIQQEMRPEPISIYPTYEGSNKLKDKIAIITGGDSGIGRAIAYHYAVEGAHIAILYLNEHEDAKKTQQFVLKQNRQCLLFSGDIGDENFCRKTIEKIYHHFNRIDVLVNNVAEQHPVKDFTDITAEQLIHTFQTNVYSFFYMTKAVLPYLKEDSAIINSTSVTAYRGSEKLVDYAATKGAIVAFTRSLAKVLMKNKIRVNAVAPGPIWTPLIVASFSAEEIQEFGQHAPMGYAGQPADVAPAYVFLASRDASYMSGQVLHPNGGEIVNA